jgi:hypothetical protein
VGTLTPTIEDPDVGLVGIAPGFNLQQYQVLIVEQFLVSPAEIKDEDDIRLAKEMSGYLHAQLVAKLKGDHTLPKIIDATTSDALPAGSGILALQGDISRLTEGSQLLRYTVGFGAGSAKAQIETRLVATDSREVQMITADRRAASGGFFGGDSRWFLTTFMDRVADGLATLLHRLAAGGQPGRR